MHPEIRYNFLRTPEQIDTDWLEELPNFVKTAPVEHLRAVLRAAKESEFPRKSDSETIRMIEEELRNREEIENKK